MKTPQKTVPGSVKPNPSLLKKSRNNGFFMKEFFEKAIKDLQDLPDDQFKEMAERMGFVSKKSDEKP